MLFFLLLSLWPSFLRAQEPTTLKRLQDLIKIDTTNPPGNEIAAARYVEGVLSQAGIASEIIESETGRGNLIARLPGNGSKPAMILLGHLDVVPADPSEWEVPPFSAAIKDGKVWGRGSLDMKGLVAMEIAAFLRVKQELLPLAGDLLLVLCADEEAGGKNGAEFLVQNHWDKLKAGYLFNEGSAGVLKDGLHLYPIQVAEKGVAWMKITARGTSGHGSMPIDDNAVVKLTRALNELSRHKFPIQKTEVIDVFLKRLGDHLPFPKSLAARNIFSPGIGPMIRLVAGKLLAKDRHIAAVLSNTISPTMLAAGYKVNVIPSEATASIDARILPGETPEGFRQKVQEIVGNDLQVELITSSLPNESNFKTDFFRTIERAVQKQDPVAVTAPILSAGATDSRFFRAKGVVSYGLVPLLLDPDELKGLHGKNERVPVEGLEKGTLVIYDVIRGMQGVSP